MADTAARLAISARRNEVARFTIAVTGIDMTGVAMAMQIRLGRDVPGAPLIALATVSTLAAEGLKLDSVTVTNGVPTSIIKGRINASTMTDATRVPYAGEMGDNTTLAYAMQWTLNGDAQTRLYGDFVVLGSAFGSDNAPTNRPQSYGMSSTFSGSSGGSLTFGNQVVSVSIGGVGELSPLLSAAAASALLSQRWAEALDQPGGTGTKSSKSWAMDAKATRDSFPDYFRGDKGNPGSSLPEAIGLFTDIPNLTIPEGVDAFDTTGHHIVGIGPARYAAVATEPGLPGAGQVRSENGRWFRIAPVLNMPTIEQAGGLGDSTWNGGTLTPGTDNLQPYKDAIAWIARPFTQDARFSWGSTVWFGGSIAGQDYYFSDTINQHGLGGIAGPGSGFDNFNNEVRLHWSGNRDSIVLNQSNTDGRAYAPAGNLKSAAGFRITGVSLFNVTCTSRVSHCIRARTPFFGSNVFIQHGVAGDSYLGGNGVHMNAQGGGGNTPGIDGTSVEGNVNYSYLQNFTIRAGGYGILVSGLDANACTFNDIKVRTCGLGGRLDTGTLGNTWIGGGVDECARGAESGYVTHKGKVWMLTGIAPGVGGATEPGTNPAVWYEYSKYPGYPTANAWVSGQNYVYSVAIGFKGGATRSVCKGPYTEGYECDTDGSPATVEGGETRWTSRSSAAYGSDRGHTSNQGWGFSYTLDSASKYWSGDPNSSNLRARLGGAIASGTILQWGYQVNSRVDHAKRLRDVEDDIVLDFGDADSNLAFGSWARFTGGFTMQKFGGPVALPYATKFDTLLISTLGDPAPGSLLAASTATPAVGVFRRGDYVRNRNIASGQPKGWGCSVGGAKGPTAWAANAEFYGFGQVRNNGGNAYVNVPAPARVPGASYAVSDMFSSMGKNYMVTTAGTTSAAANGPNGFGTAITDGTCVVAFVNGTVTATSGGPTGTSTTTPVRDGSTWWIYQPPFEFIADSNW